MLLILKEKNLMDLRMYCFPWVCHFESLPHKPPECQTVVILAPDFVSVIRICVMEIRNMQINKFKAKNEYRHRRMQNQPKKLLRFEEWKSNIFLNTSTTIKVIFNS